MGAPRQSRRDAWNPSPAVERYRAFRDELRLKAKQQGYQQGDCLDVVFHLPMPRSWSHKKRTQMDGSPHQQKPDLDNLIKAWTDTLLPESDCNVHTIRAQKRWAEKGAIVVFTEEEED